MSPNRKSGPYGEGRDDARKKCERYDIAFELAQKIHEKRKKELKAQGYSGEPLREKLGSVGETADFLFKTQARELDRLAEEKRRQLKPRTEPNRDSRQSPSKKAATEMKNLAAGFKEHLDGKRKLAGQKREQNETKATKTKDIPRQQNTQRERSTDQKPLSLRDVLRDAKQIQEEKREEARRKRFPKETARGKNIETYHEIDHFHPQVKGVKVDSFKQLQQLVDREYPGCKRIKDFDKMMEGGRKHFDLIKKLDGKTHLEYGDIARFVRELDQDFTTVKDWTKIRKPPRIYPILESAISKSEGLARIEKLAQENNGIRNMEDVDRRLGHYYAEKEYRSSKNYDKDREMAEKHFKFMDLLREGGSSTEISRQLDVGWGEVGRWYKGIAPWMIQLASSIPDQTPREGCVWLPTVTGPKNNPSGFIEVPLKITHYNQVADVLKQISSIRTADIVKLEKQFGPSSKIDSFMYSLGALLADGSSQFATDSNLAGSRFVQSFGKAYEWGLTNGEGVRYHLSKIGIQMNRLADREYNPETMRYPTEGTYDYQSDSRPFVTWMRRSGLGLKDQDSKTYDSTDAEWILSAPKEWKTSFLQGLCDGDGCASIKSQYLSIATTANTDFFMDFLKSLDIQSHKGDGAVVINKRDSVKKMNEIGMFRYAKSRKDNLEKLTKMIESIDYSNPLSDAEIKHIKELRSSGKSWGSISESLFDKFGRTLPHYSIQRRYENDENKRETPAQSD